MKRMFLYLILTLCIPTLLQSMDLKRERDQDEGPAFCPTPTKKPRAEQESSHITIITSDKHRFPIPIAVARQSNTIAEFLSDQEGVTEFDLDWVSSTQLQLIIPILRLLAAQPDLTHKALLDALDDNLKSISSTSSDDDIELLKAANYLDIKPLIETYARRLARRIEQEKDPEQFFTSYAAKLTYDTLTKNSLLALIAKYYFLLSKEHLSSAKDLNYGFSVQDYLDYQPQKLSIDEDGRLSLSNMQLHSLEGLQNIPDINNLKRLLLSNNQLTQLPENIFHNLGNLQLLDLDNNRLTQLPENIFHKLGNLGSLHLCNNRLTQLPENIFHKLGNLQSLRLDNNRLTQLPENIFHNLGNLGSLHLCNNRLTQLPENIFHKLGKLGSLHLDNNQLTQLPENIFHKLGNLQSLRLDNNRLTQLPENIFHNLGNLELLRLDNNRLTQLSKNIFHNLGNLKWLHLDKDALEKLTGLS